MVADAVNAYLQIRGAQAQITNIHEMIAIQERELALVKDRAASGAASARDVVSVASELDNVKKLLPVVEIALEVQFNLLDVLEGLQSGSNAQRLAVAAPVPDPPLLSGAIQSDELLRSRPDVIAAERHLAAANARIGQTLADYYPKLSLAGIIGFESLRANKMFTPAGFQPVGQGAIRWRIFDFGKIDAEVTNARGATAEALAGYRETLLLATEDVENALMSYDRTRIRALEISDDQSNRRRATALSRDNFNAGAESLSGVLSAKKAELAASNDLVDSRVRHAQAAVGFYRAIGGGSALPAVGNRPKG